MMGLIALALILSARQPPSVSSAAASGGASTIYLPDVPSGLVGPPASVTPTPTRAKSSTPTSTATRTPTGIATATSTATPGTGAYAEQQNITYCSPGGSAQLADVYTPQLPSGTLPLVIYVHGGGWYYGDKIEVSTTDPFLPTFTALMQHGYVVASINYRLAPANLFPAMIEDVKCAVRYFRANAGAYGVDSTRIAVWGSSAGAHLASLAAVADASAGWDVGEYPGVSSRVEGLVDWFGQEDLYLDYTENLTNPYSTEPALVVQAFGSSSPTPLALDSPVHYVSADDPPSIIRHGDQDKDVLPDQSQELSSDLTAVGVPNDFLLVQNALHEFVPIPTTTAIVPSLDEIAQETADFLDTNVKNNPNPQPQ
jgi:acetyl esterase/lipase